MVTPLSKIKYSLKATIQELGVDQPEVGFDSDFGDEQTSLPDGAAQLDSSAGTYGGVKTLTLTPPDDAQGFGVMGDNQFRFTLINSGVSSATVPLREFPQSTAPTNGVSVGVFIPGWQAGIKCRVDATDPDDITNLVLLNLA